MTGSERGARGRKEQITNLDAPARNLQNIKRKHAYKLQTPGNNPKESIQHTENGESLKLRKHKHADQHAKNLPHPAAATCCLR